MVMIIHIWSIVMLFLGFGQAKEPCTLTYKIWDGYDDYATMVYADAQIEFSCNCSCSTKKNPLIWFTGFENQDFETHKAAENKIRKLKIPVGNVTEHVQCHVSNDTENCHDISSWALRPPALCSDCQQCAAGQICMENKEKAPTCQSIDKNTTAWAADTCNFPGEKEFKQDSSICVLNNKNNDSYAKPTFCEAVLWQLQDPEQRQIMAQINGKSGHAGLCTKGEVKKMINDRLQLSILDETSQKYNKPTWALGARYILTKAVQIGILSLNTSNSKWQCSDIKFECSYKTKANRAPIAATSQEREGFCKHFVLLQNLDMGTESKVTCNVDFKIDNREERLTLFFYGIKPGQPIMQNLTCDNKYCNWDDAKILKSEYQLVDNYTAICTAEITDDFCFPKPSRRFKLSVSVPPPKCNEKPTPAPNTTNKAPLIAGVVIAVLVILIIAIIVGFVLYKRNRDKRDQVDITELGKDGQHRYHTPPFKPKISKSLEV